LTLSAFGIYIGRWKGGKEESNANTKQSGFWSAALVECLNRLQSILIWVLLCSLLWGQWGAPFLPRQCVPPQAHQIVFCLSLGYQVRLILCLTTNQKQCHIHEQFRLLMHLEWLFLNHKLWWIIKFKQAPHL
jgi:hypothetical protein